MEIGGFFELELPAYGEVHSTALCFQSARAALLAFLRVVRPARLWAPNYTCDSVLHAAAASGTELAYYSLSRDLFPDPMPKLGRDEILLFINYFGICQDQLRALSERVGLDRLVVDNSQALFERSGGHLATIYSPRKFVGAPDGGYLYVNGPNVECPPVEDDRSFQRLRGMIMRTAHSARQGYSSFVEAELSLAEVEPRAMSSITHRILASHDYNSIGRLRKLHFSIVHQIFGRRNGFPLHFGEDAVPLCYPLTLDFNCGALKSSLHDKGIFVPTYWMDANRRLPDGATERAFLDRTLFLPVDQRLTSRTISWMCDLVTELIEHELG